LNKLDTDRRTVACPFVLSDREKKNRVCRAGASPLYFFGEFPEQRHTEGRKETQGKRMEKEGARPSFPFSTSRRWIFPHKPAAFIPRSIRHFVSFPPFSFIFRAVLSLHFLPVYLPPVYLPATSSRSSLPQIFHFFFRFCSLDASYVSASLIALLF